MVSGESLGCFSLVLIPNTQFAISVDVDVPGMDASGITPRIRRQSEDSDISVSDFEDLDSGSDDDVPLAELRSSDDNVPLAVLRDRLAAPVDPGPTAPTTAPTDPPPQATAVSPWATRRDEFIPIIRQPFAGPVPGATTTLPAECNELDFVKNFLTENMVEQFVIETNRYVDLKQQRHGRD